MKSVVRSFIAVDLASGLRSEIDKTARRLSAIAPEVKWVVPEQFHLTLKFLGDVPMTELYGMIRAAESACRGVEPFDLVLSGLGAFPNLDAPRTLWVGVNEGVEEIRALAARLDAELYALGYPKESRQFMPHLTIGRLPRKERSETTDQELRDRLAQESETFFGVCPVDAVQVYSSELSRSGPKYELLSEIELKSLS